jgi:hypothetical protein
MSRGIGNENSQIGFRSSAGRFGIRSNVSSGTHCALARNVSASVIVMISAGPERGSGPSSLQVGSRSMPYYASGAIAGQVVVLRSEILESVV